MSERTMGERVTALEVTVAAIVKAKEDLEQRMRDMEKMMWAVGGIIALAAFFGPIVAKVLFK